MFGVTEGYNMTTIYDQHDTAFASVSAFALVHAGAQVGTLAFKYPADGAGRLWCYLHLHGSEMVRGSATGYGYDKAGAAFESAVTALLKAGDCPEYLAGCANIGGSDYSAALRAAGVDCWQAV
jgi:hypothetical protein